MACCNPRIFFNDIESAMALANTIFIDDLNGVSLKPLQSALSPRSGQRLNAGRISNTYVSSTERDDPLYLLCTASGAVQEFILRLMACAVFLSLIGGPTN